MVWDSLRLILGYFGGINHIKGFLDPFKFSQPCSALNYTFENATEAANLVNGSGTDGIYNLLDYNGADDLNIEVTLVDYEGNYELGKRDIGGTCIDFSTLKQRDIDDVCW